MSGKFSELLAEMRKRESEITLEKFAEMLDEDIERRQLSIVNLNEQNNNIRKRLNQLETWNTSNICRLDEIQGARGRKPTPLKGLEKRMEAQENSGIGMPLGDTCEKPTTQPAPDPNDPKNWIPGETWLEYLFPQNLGPCLKKGAGMHKGGKYLFKELFCGVVGTKIIENDNGEEGYADTKWFSPCSPPSKWDEVKYVKINGWSNVYEARQDPKYQERMLVGKCVKGFGNVSNIEESILKSRLTPLREVRKPGRKKGEFVECCGPSWMTLGNGERVKLGYILDADEPDTVTHEECKDE